MFNLRNVIFTSIVVLHRCWDVLYENKFGLTVAVTSTCLCGALGGAIVQITYNLVNDEIRCLDGLMRKRKGIT